jgi:cobalt transporter subunit CbtA
MFRRIIFAAALSGLIGGLVLSATQAIRVVPLIKQAEIYENAPAAQPYSGTAAPHAHEPAAVGKSDLTRTALTAVSNVVTSIAFALILIAGISFRGGANWRQGILWGLGGYAAFNLAPSIGLPLELPGTFAAAVPDRQIWWLLTAVLTAGGLTLAVFARDWKWKALGALLIALPHLIGAPQPARHGGLAPEAMKRDFAFAALAVSGVFWIALGSLSSYFFTRFEKV